MSGRGEDEPTGARSGTPGSGAPGSGAPELDPARELFRFGGEWICVPCDDRLTDRVAFGGGMPIENWFPRMFPWLFGRRRRELHTGRCDTCGAEGWYLG